MDLKHYIRKVPDFPTPGILFRDITPLIASGKAFRYSIDELAKFAKSKGAEKIIGPESRGFFFGCPVAFELGIGFIPARKPYKLPRPVYNENYDLEYGQDAIQIHQDAFKPGEKVVIIDDLLATGGTLAAVIRLIEKAGAQIVGIGFVVELQGLGGRQRFANFDIFSLVKYK
ncbi:MAG: adenine phosphoribosyltransferase [Firmicutes bacterium]|nr:adenine phosphoribosyltransferase [Bacillota bacterium]